MIFYETTAITGENIEKAMYIITEKACNSWKNKNIFDTNTIQLTLDNLTTNNNDNNNNEFSLNSMCNCILL